MKAALRGKKISAALTNKNVDADITGEVLAFKISALGDNPLRAVQSYSTVSEAWEKFQIRYAGKILINKLVVLNILLSMKMKKEEQMSDHIAKLETRFARLAAMNDTVSESMQVAILVSSLLNLPEDPDIIASINTKNADEITRNYVSTTHIQKQERHGNQQRLRQANNDILILAV